VNSGVLLGRVMAALGRFVLIIDAPSRQAG